MLAAGHVPLELVTPVSPQHRGGVFVYVDGVLAGLCLQIVDDELVAIGAQPEAHQREAQAFVSTFLSKKLDQEWLIKGLEVVVSIAGVTWLGGRVIGALVELASVMPGRATSLTLAILRRSGNDWDYTGWRKKVREVLALTRDSRDEETIENRKAIIDLYVSRREFDFRTLV